MFSDICLSKCNSEWWEISWLYLYDFSNVYFISVYECGDPPYFPTMVSKIKKDFTLKWLEEIGKEDLKECYPRSDTPSQKEDLCKPFSITIPKP